MTRKNIFAVLYFIGFLIASCTKYEIFEGDFGYIDRTGKIVIKPQFDSLASDFSEGLASVRARVRQKLVFFEKKADYFGFIDKEGNVVINPSYISVGRFSDGLAPVKAWQPKVLWRYDQKWGFIDHFGKTIIKPKFYNASSFSEGLARVQFEKRFPYLYPFYNFIDKSGEIIIDTPYTDARDFHEGLAAVGRGYYGYDGYINEKERMIIKRSSVGAVVFPNDKSTDASLLYELRRHNIHVYFDNFASELDTDVLGKCMLIINYFYFGDFSQGLAPVDFSRELINQNELEYTLGNSSENYSINDLSGALKAVKLGDRLGYIDKTGMIVIKPVFDGALNFSEGLAPARKGGKWGFIDQAGEYVIKPQFDKALSFSEGMACVSVSGKYGYIGKDGNFVIQPTFDNASSFSDGLARVKIRSN